MGEGGVVWIEQSVSYADDFLSDAELELLILRLIKVSKKRELKK